MGKRELAVHLGWSRPTLDKRMKVDANFPVRRMGDQSGGWEFDRDEVDRYLAGEPTPPAMDKAQPAATVMAPLPQAPPGVKPVGNATALRPRSAYHSGEATARQRKDDADASLKEDKLRELRGELVQKSEICQILNTVFLRLGHDLDALPEKLIKALDLREDAAPGVRAMIDQIRTEMVHGAMPLLQPDEPPAIAAAETPE